MAIKELPRFKIFKKGAPPVRFVRYFGKDGFLPLFSTPETARQFISVSAHEYSRSGQLEWPALYDFLKSFTCLKDLKAIVVDHDGTTLKQTVQSFPFASVMDALVEWDLAGDREAPILAESLPREIEGDDADQSEIPE